MKTNICFLMFMLVFIVANVFASDTNQTKNTTHIKENYHKVYNSVSSLTRYAVSPYFNLAITSCLSIIEKKNNRKTINNEVANEYLGNYYVLGILTFLVLVIWLSHFIPFAKPLINIFKYLEKQSSLVLIGFQLFSTFIIRDDNPSNLHSLTLAGFSIPFMALTFTIIGLLNYYIIIVVRFFIEILASITHIPYLNIALEICKTIISLLLFLISILFPPVAFILCLIILFISLVLFNKARRETNYFVTIYIARFFSILFKSDKPAVSPIISKRIKKGFPEIQFAAFCFPISQCLRN